MLAVKHDVAGGTSHSSWLSRKYQDMQLRRTYQILLWIVGLPVHLIVFFYYLHKRKQDTYIDVFEEVKHRLIASGDKEKIRADIHQQVLRKKEFFNEKIKPHEIDKQTKQWTEETFQKIVRLKVEEELKSQGQAKITFEHIFVSLLSNRIFLIASFIPGLPMYVVLFLYGHVFLKYIVERLFMSVFVIIGVVILVFTILYFSPFDPAANILGESATKEQIATFNHLYGLDQSYIHQLWNALKGFFTFDLGKSFTGNEEVATSIVNRFPITLTLAVWSLVMAIVVAIPIGVMSATRPYSFFDYSFMFIALLGLSIPNFWQGLIFILNFSIKWQWLPATYSPGNWLSMLMPVVVLGTGLTASIARMTRSSMLEVMYEDYMITAKAKGLSQQHILWRHGIGNAMIPIITVIGLLFGAMLGGAAVTEKVFNISGIGSYIVDKQFIPDIPSILGGVVYVAITISLVNVIIDILYAFFDPRIRSKMKQY
ncbi:ABC transporter permease [Bacillus australimaris]|uniref:ABC transporter permease n=1 Tax=Bacillus australimaris TaxID=1326968 RepID=UPI0039B42C4B